MQCAGANVREFDRKQDLFDVAALNCLIAWSVDDGRP